MFTNQRDLAHYNNSLLQQWAERMTMLDQEVIICFGIDSMNKLAMYSIKGLSPEQIAMQLETIVKLLREQQTKKG